VQPALTSIARLDKPPFTLRARLLTPLDDGGTRFLSDASIEVDAAGRLARVEEWSAQSGSGAIDIRPLIVMPGLVDLHAHLPQWPNAGLGAGLDLLTWLQRYIFPLEREFHADAARRLAPLFGTHPGLGFLDVGYSCRQRHSARQQVIARVAVLYFFYVANTRPRRFFKENYFHLAGSSLFVARV